MKFIYLTVVCNLAKTTETQECPFGGIYAVNVPGGNNNRPMGVTSDRTLISCSEQSFNSKCNANDHMQLESRCGYKDTTRSKIFIIKIIVLITINFLLDFRCLGGWNENGTNYLIASSNEDMFRKYCLVYNKFNGQIHMTISSATCVRSIINYKSNTQLNYKDSHMGLILTFRGNLYLELFLRKDINNFVFEQMIVVRHFHQHQVFISSASAMCSNI